MVKKLISALLALSLLGLGGVYASSGDVIFKEDFNAMKSGNLPAGGWTLTDVTEGKSKIIISERADQKGDMCLDVFDDDTTKSAVAASKFAMQTEDFSVSFDYFLKKGSNQPATIAVMKEGAWPPAVTLLASSNIFIFDGANGKDYKKGASLDAWHTIVLHVHPPKGTFDAYFDGEKIATEIKFRNEALKEIDRIQLGLASVGTASSAFYDNVEISKGIKEVKAAVATPNAPSIGGSDKIKIIPSATDVQTKMFQKIHSAVVLAVGENNAFVLGEEKLIDNHIEVVPFTVDGRTLVPVRFIAESFDAKVEWIEETATVKMNANGKDIALTLGSNQMKIGNETKTIDVPANTYGNRTFIPLRAMAEALGKKVFWDDRGLIVISSEENILDSQNDAEILDMLQSAIKGGREKNAFKKYSSTFFSTRIFRNEGTTTDPMTGKAAPKEGTINTARQMMLTDDLWTYVGVDAANYKTMTDSGVSVQAAIGGMLNLSGPAEVLEKGVTRTFEGKTITAPWVTNVERPYAAALSEEFFQYNKKAAMASIDKGIYSFQHDDWMLDVSSLGWGGGFYDVFLDYFKEYLKRNYTKEQLKGLGVDHIDTFSYRTYLTEKLGIKTDADYLAKKAQSKLDPMFLECAKEVTIKYHIRMRRELNEYAGRNVAYSVNASMLAGIDSNQAIANDIIDFQMGEAPDGSYTARNIAVWGAVVSGMHKTSVMSPIPKNVTDVKIGLATAYATGQFMNFPWDVYVDWESPRYFGTTEDYAKEYHFIRQYEQLFNGYEINAKVGVLSRRSAMDKSTFSNTLSSLFTLGIPYKSMMSSEGYPTMGFSAEDLAGLSYLVAHTPIEKFSQEEQQVIKDSGIAVIDENKISDLKEEIAVAVSSSQKVYTVLREKNSNNRVIHVLNQADCPLNDIVLNIAEKTIPIGATLTYYRPGYDPITLARNGNKVVLPTTEFWGILKMSSEEAQNALGEGMSYLGIGAPARDGSANLEGDTLTMRAKGLGLNVGIANDEGSFDQISLVYQNRLASSLQKTSTVARFESASTDGAIGIMDRKNPSSNSPFIALVYENGALFLTSREQYNAPTISKKLVDAKLPIDLKLTRQGNTYTAYAAPNGKSFGEALITKEFSLGDRITGVFASTLKDANTVTLKNVAFESGQVLDQVTSIEVKAPQNVTVGKSYMVEAFANRKDASKIPLYAGDINYSISNEKGASISKDGKLILKEEGEFIIKAELGNISAEALVRAEKPNPIILKENFDTISDLSTLKELETNNPSIKIVDKTLLVGSDGPGKTSDAKFKTPEMTGNVTYEFDFKAVFGKNENAGGARVIYVGTDSFSISLIANPTGFEYFFGATNKVIAPIEQNKWYKIKIVADFKNTVADVYIDDKQVVSSGSFRTARASAYGVWFGGFRVNEDTFYSWDNINIYRN